MQQVGNQTWNVGPGITGLPAGDGPGPGPGKVGHENSKTPPLVTSPQDNPKPKTEIFLSRN